MVVQLNHTIVPARDKRRSAYFLSEILGLDDPVPFGPFMAVAAGNDVTLDFADHDGEIEPGHYAFLVSEQEFDAVFGRIRDRKLAFWADPHHHQPSEINTRDNGRGVYFDSPEGHVLEILTRPYGSGQ